MATTAKAVYLRGDPGEPGPIPRGRLRLQGHGLYFTDPGGADMRIEVEQLRAVTVTGRRPNGVPGRVPRGTLKLASQHEGSVAVWEFAVDRALAAGLRDDIDRILAQMQRPALPFVEQLLESEGEIASGNGSNAQDENGDWVPRDATDSGPRIKPSLASRPRSELVKRRRWILLGAVVAVFATAEIVLPLLLTH
jgi:hypothetical protein